MAPQKSLLWFATCERMRNLSFRNRHALACLWMAGLLFSVLPAEAKRTVAQKKQAAHSQFETAERLHEALDGKPEKSRTRKDYQRVIDAYRKVYYTAPTSNKADASALAVADLMVAQGRQFNDDKMLTDAIAQYEFLRREYPGSRYRVQALFSIGKVQQDDLGQLDKAKATFDEFVNRYPRHELAKDAMDAVKEMAAQAKAAKTTGKKNARPEKTETAKSSKARPAPKKSEDDEEEPAASSQPAAKPVLTTVVQDSPHKGKLPLLTNVRYWSTPDYTRVAIDLEDGVKYEAGRVPDPDRIFFDLHDTKLASELAGKSFDVDEGFLKRIRVAQYTLTSTRVVLEVDDVAEYSAFLLPNPYRLIIDIHGKKPAQVVAQAAKPASAATEPSKPAQKPLETKTAESRPPETKPETSKTAAKPVEMAKAEPPALKPAADSTREVADASNTESKKKEIRATSEPTTSPTFESVAPRNKKGKKAKPAPEPEEPKVHAAEPDSNGDRSLIRALGLKIGKIVVDAGHGGHDTGTVGPNGLMEKDLVLDVAQRLGAMLEKRLGAEVVYTRDDDTFIPLETRTAIANQHEADLFISVHANSSRDLKARGVETYYLNFTSNAEALEVAARENAVSEKSVFELQDLVKKIALKEKIDESREFASEVQKNLYGTLSNKNPGLRNRGVKKAPFVVLIGANMPSILAEISFVSNPTDEKKLKTGDYRQRVAEALFKGVAAYANSLSGVRTSNSKLAQNSAVSGN